jgi:hypothetical protein
MALRKDEDEFGYVDNLKKSVKREIQLSRGILKVRVEIFGKAVELKIQQPAMAQNQL